MPTYWIHTQKAETAMLQRVFPQQQMISSSTDIYYHFSLKTGGRGLDKALHPENRELLTMLANMEVKDIDAIAMKGGFIDAQNMLYMCTGRPFGYTKRKIAGSNEQQKRKHMLVMEHVRDSVGKVQTTVVEYTTKSVTERKNPDTDETLQKLAMLDWKFNQSAILADAYSDNLDADHAMALWFNESRKLHPAPVTAPATQPTATAKVA